VAFLSLSPAEVYASSYVGEAEATVRRAFTLARSAAPCILFFDEMDSIFGGSDDNSDGGGGGGGGGRGSSAEARVLSTFLNEMDGVDSGSKDGVLVLGATNRPWTLDAALLRPGRLGDKIIYIPPPDVQARRAILEMQFGNHHDHDNDSDELLLLDLDFEYLASDSMSGLFTGAELVGACQEAKMRLLRDMTAVSNSGEEEEKEKEAIIHSTIAMKQEYVEQALQSIKPLLSDPQALQEFRLFDRQQSSTSGVKG
jgi:SpoVK/Ycf46/Vps4 family AAA+-type ATPase